jgi:hypothetical protein
LWLALTVSAAILLLGGAFLLGMAFERARDRDETGMAPGPFSVVTPSSDRANTKVSSSGTGHRKASADQAGRSSGRRDPGIRLPRERELARSLLIARKRYINRTAVTRFQRINRNEPVDGFCKPTDKRYLCTISELLPAPSYREEQRVCRDQARTPRQKRDCNRLPPSSRTESSIEFSVTMDRNGCWLASLPHDRDPSGSANLAGCFSGD